MKSAYKTIPVKPATYRRLLAYKSSDETFDHALNVLMDAYPLEVVSQKFIREYKRRIKNFKGVPLEQVRKELGVE